jgi:hypothetical protein
VDHNLPPALARGLNALFDGEHEIVALRAKFGRSGVPDDEWITELGKEGGWTVLSGDLRIAKKRPSRELFLRSNLVGFFPLPSVLEQPFPKMTARILTVWPTLVDLVNVSARGVYEISIKGSKFRQISS